MKGIAMKVIKTLVNICLAIVSLALSVEFWGAGHGWIMGGLCVVVGSACYALFCRFAAAAITGEW